VRTEPESIRRWLNRITPDRDTLQKHWCLRHFTELFLDHRRWMFNRSSVSKAFASGLFIAFIPPTPLLPLHLLVCALLCAYCRMNLPVLFSTVFVSNPFTWVPQVAGSLWVGAKLMGLNLMPFLHAISRRTFWADIHVLWAPLLLGALVLGILAAACGYLLAQAVWRARVMVQLRRRRARSCNRGAALD
jgi:uncharacterized protein (DUF2062 family)